MMVLSNKPIRNCNCTYVTHGNAQYLSLMTLGMYNGSSIGDDWLVAKDVIKGHKREILRIAMGYVCAVAITNMLIVNWSFD